jgi:hypothetical protein
MNVTLNTREVENLLIALSYFAANSARPLTIFEHANLVAKLTEQLHGTR